MSAAGPAPPFRSRSWLHLAAPAQSRPGAFPVCGSRQPAPRSPAPFPCRLAARRWSVPGGSVRLGAGSAALRIFPATFSTRSAARRPVSNSHLPGAHTLLLVVHFMFRRSDGAAVPPGANVPVRGRRSLTAGSLFGGATARDPRQVLHARHGATTGSCRCARGGRWRWPTARSPAPGRDRLADRGRATGVPPFEEAVEKVIGIDSEACTHPDRTQRQWRGWLYDHACARIGDAVSRNPSAGPTVRSATASCPDSPLSSGRQVPHGGRALAETPEALGGIHPQRRPPARRRRQLRRPRPFRPLLPRASPLLPRASPRGCVSVSGPPLGRRLGNGCADRCRRAAWTRRLRLRVVDRPVANGTAPRYTRYVAGFSC